MDPTPPNHLEVKWSDNPRLGAKSPKQEPRWILGPPTCNQHGPLNPKPGNRHRKKTPNLKPEPFDVEQIWRQSLEVIPKNRTNVEQGELETCNGLEPLSPEHGNLKMGANSGTPRFEDISIYREMIG